LFAIERGFTPFNKVERSGIEVNDFPSDWFFLLCTQKKEPLPSADPSVGARTCLHPYTTGKINLTMSRLHDKESSHRGAALVAMFSVSAALSATQYSRLRRISSKMRFADNL